MKTYSIEHVLRKKLAYVPGALSKIGRLLMIIPLSDSPLPPVTTSDNCKAIPNNDPESEDLEITLNFYAQLFRFNEIADFNLIVIIDNRCGNWKRLRHVLKAIKMCLPQVAVALVVKSDSSSTPLYVKLWLNRTRQTVRRASSFGNLCGSSGDVADYYDDSNDDGMIGDKRGSLTASMTSLTTAVRPSTVLVISQSKLETYVYPDQMPVEFGGAFTSYNHSTWLMTRISAERFVDRVESLIARRFFTEDGDNGDNDDSTFPTAGTYGIADYRVRHLISEGDEVNVSQLLDLGRHLCDALSHRANVPKLSGDLTASVQMAVSSLEPMAILEKPKISENNENSTHNNNNAEDSSLPIVKIYGPPLKRNCQPQKVILDKEEIEREINEIRRWLANDGDRLIMCETDCGTSLRAAERLVDKHELIEMDCADVFARYSRLIATLDMVLGRQGADDAMTASGLCVQRAELESSLRTFAMRIDRRRTLLLTCARFFRLFNKSLSALRGVSKILSASDDSGVTVLSSKQQDSLETHRNRAEILGAKTMEEGARLVQMLVDGTGRSDIVRDYSHEILVVVKHSELLRDELDAMELWFSPAPSSSDSHSSDDRHATTDEGVNVSSSDDGAATAKKKAVINSWHDEDYENFEELVTVFVQTLEQQLATVCQFVRTFSSEIASSSIQPRDLLKKYQNTYYDLEHQWHVMNTCGLDFVGRIIKANSVLSSSSLAAIENALIELNRQFSQVRTLWKDVQISKVQSDIVKLLKVCSKSKSASSSSINSVGKSDNKKTPCQPLSLAACASQQSSGLPSSASSSPPIAVKASPGKTDRHRRNIQCTRRYSTVTNLNTAAVPLSRSKGGRWLSNPELRSFDEFL